MKTLRITLPINGLSSGGDGVRIIEHALLRRQESCMSTSIRQLR